MKPRAWFGSATNRLVALAFLLQLAATAAVLAYVYLHIEQQVRSEQRAAVLALRDDLLAEYRVGGTNALVALSERRAAAREPHGPVILLTDAAGARLAGNLQSWPPTIPADESWHATTLFKRDAVAPQPMLLTAIRLPEGLQLLTGRVTEGRGEDARTLAEALLVAALIAIPLALLVAALIGRRIGRRLEETAATAVSVTGGALSRRVPRDNSLDPFDRLAGTINAMLERIEALVGELRTVTDALAHDLRSPLTRLRSAVERGQAPGGDPQAALVEVERESTAILAMIEATLRISRAEAGISPDAKERVDLAAMLDDLAELYEPLAEQRGMQIVHKSAAPVHASVHRQMLLQAVSNLIENALNYAEGGDCVTLAVARTDDLVRITVADNGPGIAPERREDALKRYVRLDPARSRAGHGLGLALVQAVAHMHGGTVELGDAEPGLAAAITLRP